MVPRLPGAAERRPAAARMETTISKWPKVRPPLTAEQARINDEFLKRFLTELQIQRSADGKVVTFRIRSDVDRSVSRETSRFLSSPRSSSSSFSWWMSKPIVPGKRFASASR